LEFRRVLFRSASSLSLALKGAHFETLANFRAEFCDNRSRAKKSLPLHAMQRDLHGSRRTAQRAARRIRTIGRWTDSGDRGFSLSRRPRRTAEVRGALERDRVSVDVAGKRAVSGLEADIGSVHLTVCNRSWRVISARPASADTLHGSRQFVSILAQHEELCAAVLRGSPQASNAGAPGRFTLPRGHLRTQFNFPSPNR